MWYASVGKVILTEQPFVPDAIRLGSFSSQIVSKSGPRAHTPSCAMGTGCFSGVKCGRGVLLTTHPLLVPRSWKSRDIPLPTLWAKPGL